MRARTAASAVAAAAPAGRRWLQRLGAAGFLFFLFKGLLWLTLPALLAYLGYR
jgi:hypothetical protein